MNPTTPCIKGYRLNFKNRRLFSSTRYTSGYYRTLCVPRNATKRQIKASFYKLSKLHHPDLAKDPNSTAKFQEVNDAYAVLSDDKKRAEYDRSLDVTRTPFTQNAHSNSYYPEYGTRKRGATHAWERARHQAHTSHRYSGSTFRPDGFPQHPHTHPHARDPFSSPNVQRATGQRANHNPHRDVHPTANVSSFWRAMQVIGVVMLVTMIGGGTGASAA